MGSFCSSARQSTDTQNAPSKSEVVSNSDSSKIAVDGKPDPSGEEPKPPAEEPAVEKKESSKEQPESAADQQQPPAEKPQPPAEQPTPPAEEPKPTADQSKPNPLPNPPAAKHQRTKGKPKVPAEQESKSKPPDEQSEPKNKPPGKEPQSKPAEKPESKSSVVESESKLKPPADKPKPAVEEPQSKPKPAAEEPQSKPKPAAEEPQSKPKPAAEEPQSKRKPAAEEPQSKPKPAAEEPQSKPKPAAEEPQSKPKPAAEEPETKPKPAAEEPETKPKPPTKEPETKPKPPTKEPETEPKPPVEEIQPKPKASVEDVETKSKPIPKKKESPAVPLSRPVIIVSKHYPGAESPTYEINPNTGHYEFTMDLRESSGSDTHVTDQPESKPGERYTDQAFPLSVAYPDYHHQDIGWKRPGEIYTTPALFWCGECYYKSGPVQDRTSRFLCTVAELSASLRLIHRVLAVDGWNPDRGLVTCNFYDFDEWRAIYADDFLPEVKKKPVWGFSNKQDVWVALLAKAYARFHMSYDAVMNGQFGDAFFALTGGLAERLDLDRKPRDPVKLFHRITSAVQSEAWVMCYVTDDHHGLAAKHSYVVTGTGIVQANDQKVCLIKLKCPLGTKGNGWTGPWSHGSKEWESVSQKTVDEANTEEREFWMSFDDFLKYFVTVTICSLSANLDSNGGSQALCYVTRIYGEWNEENAGKSPEIHFTVPEKAVVSIGWIPLYVQLIQKSKGKDRAYIKCELLDKCSECSEGLVPGNVSTYGTGLQVSRLYHITPGKYTLRPRTRDPVKGKQTYLIKLYTPIELAELRHT